MAISPDLLNEYCSSLASYTDGDNGTAVSEVSPAGQFRFDTNGTTNSSAVRYRTISSPPNQFTVEIETYFDAIGTKANLDTATFLYSTATWAFYITFASDGLYVKKVSGDSEVGADIVKCNASAALQKFRFQVNKSTGEANATVEVFLDGVSQGTFDCDYAVSYSNGFLYYSQASHTTANRVSHINYIKIGTGLGEFTPVISTQDCSLVTTTTATLNGTIVSVSSDNVIQRGFVYKVGNSGDPTIGGAGCTDVHEDGSWGASSFYQNITGLLENTNYRVRAYGINTSGTAYGATVDMKTIGAGFFLVF